MLLKAILTITILMFSSIAFANSTPSDSEILSGISRNTGNTRMINARYEVYPMTEYSGRISAVGELSLSEDLYSAGRQAERVYDLLEVEHFLSKREVTSLLQSYGREIGYLCSSLMENDIVYRAGSPLSFRMELNYRQVVDGFEFSRTNFSFVRPNGRSQPDCAFEPESARERELIDWIVSTAKLRIDGYLARSRAKGAESSAAKPVDLMDLQGLWRGTILQPGSKSGSYGVVVAISDHSVTVTYPDLACSGQWSFEEKIDNNRWLFSELITDGTNNCTTEGRVVVTLRENGVAYYEWLLVDGVQTLAAGEIFRTQ